MMLPIRANRLVPLCALMGAALASALPAVAQVGDANVRAVNTARNWAVNANGGLAVYVPASCMFETSNGGGPCLISNTPQGFVFRFAGGSPGWQAEGRPPSLETQILISPDGRTVLNVPYNGSPR